jgi:hypothetical protein
MDLNDVDGLQARTDSKIRFAQIHLDELTARNISNGDDFERAHQESFLYHLLGVKESFLIELNAYYKTELSEKRISIGNMKKALAERGQESNELTEIYRLQNDESSWLFQAKIMRDYSTHVGNVPRHFHLGGVHHNQTFLSNPETNRRAEKTTLKSSQVGFRS